MFEIIITYNSVDVYELLKDNLCQDDAVVGEAAGLAMGLVMIGTRSPTAIQDMIEVNKLHVHVHVHGRIGYTVYAIMHVQCCIEYVHVHSRIVMDEGHLQWMMIYLAACTCSFVGGV